MDFVFSGENWVWPGPAPWYFVTMPEQQSQDLKAIANIVTYGWGMIPVQAQIGKTRWKTSLFEKDRRYIVPIKASVRQKENLELGDQVTISLEVDWRNGK